MDLREIDALIAEHVMGWKVTRDMSGEYWTRPGENMAAPGNLVPKYSSDISAAWEVVRVLNEQGVYLSIHTGPNQGLKVACQRYNSIDIDEGTIVNDTEYVAICLAALKLKAKDIRDKVKDINYEL